MTVVTPIELPADDTMEKQPIYTSTHEVPTPTTNYAYPTGQSPPPTFTSLSSHQQQPTPPQMAYQQEKPHMNSRTHEYHHQQHPQGQFIPQPGQPIPPSAMNYQQQPQMQQQHQHQYSMPIQPVPPPVMASNAIQYQTATPIPALGMSPAPVDCPMCGQRRMTSVSHRAGNTTHVWAGITFCLTGCLCFIPYLMNGLKDVQHRCGNCGVHLATWHKSGQVEVHAHS